MEILLFHILLKELVEKIMEYFSIKNLKSLPHLQSILEDDLPTSLQRVTLPNEMSLLRHSRYICVWKKKDTPDEHIYEIYSSLHYLVTTNFKPKIFTRKQLSKLMQKLCSI